ncbi:MAG: DNA polymerase/3'-5' exonuclease PolX [Isosphaeraceae bacterium]|nr:DNA polymerase/3'-5' exonuclease PolX [Isosphaeraceae bacterium]
MPLHNADIAAVFNEAADLLELEEANPFRVRAYRTAARVVSDLRKDVGTMIQAGEDLAELPGIGEDLAGKIREIAQTGSCSLLRALRTHTSPALVKLMTVPGLGPKRVRTLNRELNIRTIDQLARAARGGRIRRLAGFGEKTEQNILQALAAKARSGTRLSLAIAAQYAEPLVAYLQATPGVDAVVVAGSYRRCKETVGDIDILATAVPSSPVIERFASYDEIARVLARGTTRATVVLRSGLQVDLRVVRKASYGAALHYFTGSKPHNIAIRQLGQQAGLKINEYGVFRDGQRIAGTTEESVFASVGLPWIPPELREDRGEVVAAQAGRLPRLVELADLRGDLHSHTTATDGRNTLREMATEAQRRGFEYLAVTDHSQRVRMVHGLDPERLLAQVDEIDRLNRELEGLTVLKGIEVDILEDGRLDLPDEVLARLDLVIGSIHSHFGLSKQRQTTRLLKAMDRPHFSILGHPTGRLIPTREPYDVDLPQVLRHARKRGCFVELDAHPERLDLNDLHCRMAKDEGVLVSIDSDAHSIHDLDNLRFGIGQARRGWLEKTDVLNTRPLSELRRLLASGTGGSS